MIVVAADLLWRNRGHRETNSAERSAATSTLAQATTMF